MIFNSLAPIPNVALLVLPQSIDMVNWSLTGTTAWLLCVVGHSQGPHHGYFVLLVTHRDRIMVTLSCLIVEAGLYSQVSTSTPSTSSPKLLDFYFFYSIFRLFVVCVHHTISYRWLLFLEEQDIVSRRQQLRRRHKRLRLTKAFLDNVVDQCTYEPDCSMGRVIPDAPVYLPPFPTLLINENWVKDEREVNQLKSCCLNQLNFKLYNKFIFFVFEAIEIILGTLVYIFVMDAINDITTDFDENFTFAN